MENLCSRPYLLKDNLDQQVLKLMTLSMSSTHVSNLSRPAFFPHPQRQ